MNTKALYAKLKYRWNGWRDNIRAISIPDSYSSICTCDVLLCCNDVSRGETLAGRAYSRLIDSVAEDLTQRGWVCAQFAIPFSELVGARAWGFPVSANRRMFFGMILQRLYRLGVRFRFAPGNERNNKILSYQERLYDDLLDRTQCRCVIMIGLPAALCSVARARQVPAIELLHGSWSEIPYYWDRDTKYLPTAILSLDSASTNTFSRLQGKGVVTKQISHPWFRRFTDPVLRTQLPEEWKQPLPWLPKDRRIVMISLQWGYDGDHGPHRHLAGILQNGLMPDELTRAIELTQLSVFWLLRLHPVQLRRRRYNHHREFLGRLCQQNRNCEWQQASTLPLPLLLQHCHGLITMSSGTAYEAAYMALPSLLLCPTLQSGAVNEKRFEDLRLAGFAALGRLDTQMIKSWAEGATRRSSPFGETDTEPWTSVIEWMLGNAHKP